MCPNVRTQCIILNLDMLNVIVLTTVDMAENPNVIIYFILTFMMKIYEYSLIKERLNIFYREGK